MPFTPARALRPGDHVRVIAPSSPFDREGFDRGVARLRERYEVSWDAGLFAADGYLAGSDARRLEELRRALTDASFDAVVAARGGYGATRLLRHLDPAMLRADGPLLVGFSDVTALHALFARAGRCSLHGPMVAALGRAEPAWVERWIDAVEGAPPPDLRGLLSIAPGVAEGPVVGGNLAVLAALVGTPHAPPVDGAILFLEDVGEAPYRVDRMLTQLEDAGWLERAAGVALGSFAGCDPRADGRTVQEVLAERLGGRGIPVVGGLAVGHHPDDVELPLGAIARIDGDGGALDWVTSGIVREPAPPLA